MSEEFSMTPPLTPPIWGQDDDIDMDSDSLDYLDFFNCDPIPQPQPQQPSSSLAGCGSIVYFNCKGPPRWTEELCRESYLGTGSLTSLLHKNSPCPSTLPYPTTTVFHLPPPTPDNLYLNLHQYFLALRMSISELERNSQSSFNCSQPSMTNIPGHTSQYAKIRQDSATFFNHLASLTQSLQSGDEVVFLERVRECVLATLRYLGPMHHLPPHVTAAASTQGNKCPSAPYHLFHLHLDVRWWSLALLHTLPPPPSHTPTPLLVQEPPPPPQGAGGGGGERGTGQETGETIRQCVSMVTWDLLHVLAQPAVQTSVGEVENVLCWPCGCCVELAVSLLHLLDHHSTHHASQNFWEELKNKVMVLLKMYMDFSSASPSTTTSPLQPIPASSHLTPASPCLPIVYPSDALKSVGLAHIWWIYYTYSRLYLYDQTGKVRTDKKEVKGEPKLLRTLIKLTFADPRVATGNNKPSEAMLRSALRCCVVLCQLWGVEGASWEWVGPLWEHFSRRFNDSFVLPGANMDVLTSHSRTVGGWMEEIRGCRLDAITPKHTSWQLFLTLLISVVEGSNGSVCGNMGWRQVRGRVYSRFHGRLMAELTATGITHATSLFLTLATVVDTLDVSNKLCELLSLVGDRGSASRTRVVWRSFLATALVLLGAGANLKHLASKFTPMVTGAASHYAATGDPTTRRELGQLLIIYAEGVQEVFKLSVHLSLSQHSLLCGGVVSVLSQAGISEVKAVLEMLHTALNKVLTLSNSTHMLQGGLSEALSVVWVDFVPFLYKHSCTLTPPNALGEVAACLTLCLTRLAPIASSTPSLPTNTAQMLPKNGTHTLPKNAAQTLLSYFLTNEKVNTMCRLHYLSWLLQNFGPSDTPWPGLEHQMVSSWLCALVSVGSVDEVKEVAICLTALPGLSRFLPRPVPTCPYSLARSLMKTVGQKVSSAQSPSERMNLRDQLVPYFTGIDRAGGKLMKKTPPPPHLPKSISILADLIMYTHNIIYIQSKPTCLLPGLMSGVFLPSVVFCTDKPLPPPLSMALVPAIPKVIRGLGCLDISQDKYLQRCIRDTFTHYLPRYSPSGTTSHPILVCLQDGDYDDEDVAGLGVTKKLRRMFLEVVRDNFIVKKAHLTTALSVVLQGVDRGGNVWVEVCCDVILLPLLEMLLNMEDLGVKKCATHLLKQLLTKAHRTEVPPREVLVDIVRKLVSRQMCWSSGSLFRVLRVASVMHKEMVMDAVPHIMRTVIATEEKRGIGLDNTLRQGFQSLLNTLGISEDSIQYVR